MSKATEIDDDGESLTGNVSDHRKGSCKVPELGEQLRKAAWNAIRKTLNKFREQPFYFFTESDLHSYFYHCLYSSKYEIERDGKQLYLIHREYPTNFRYTKDSLLLETYTEPYPLTSRRGDRGNFDIGILNPAFVLAAPSIQDIVNKNVRLLEDRVTYDLDAVRRELLFAIEFKYVTRNTGQFVSEVIQDNKKLSFAKQWGAAEAVNLVFCNLNESYASQVRDTVLGAPSDVHAFFAQAYFDEDGRKFQKLESNVSDRRYAWLDNTASIGELPDENE